MRGLAPSPRAASTRAAEAEAFSRRVRAAERRVRKRLPDIHPFDLHTIVHSLLLPLERRVWFLKRRADGGYGF